MRTLHTQNSRVVSTLQENGSEFCYNVFLFERFSGLTAY